MRGLYSRTRWVNGIGVEHHSRHQWETRLCIPRAAAGCVNRQMPVLKIATWNVNGIRAREAQFRQWVERERPDIVCLQEIKSTAAQVPPSLCELQGYRCYWHGAGAYSGVGLHIRRDARIVICGDVNVTRT